jgi:hypothetical protein
MSTEQTNQAGPKIIDVIAKKSGITDQVHYYVIVDRPISFTYTRSPVVDRQLFAKPGQSFFLGRCGDFYDFMAGTGLKGPAFGGREFDIPLDDGTTFHCAGDVWACGRRESDPKVISVGAKTLEQLKECYVFFTAHVTVDALAAWLAENEPSSDYHKYDTRPKFPPTYVRPKKPKRQRKRSAAYRARRAERAATKLVDNHDAS